MQVLKKQKNKDFKILNIADPQLSIGEIEERNNSFKIMTGTVRELVERVKPDLITCTGDFGYCNETATYEFYADFLGSFNIPWAFAFGNHDQMHGEEFLKKAEDAIKKGKNCLYEHGDDSLGFGNYIIGINENDSPVEALIFMDSHNMYPYNGEMAWAKLLPNQLEWYGKQIEELKQSGYKDSTVFMHIPHFGYRTAYAEAALPKEDENTLEDKWKPGFEGAFGVQLEGICSYPEEDGTQEAFEKYNHTHTVIAGHDHVNDWVIPYHGIYIAYALKTGPGCYWKKELNGGTVITIGENGVKNIKHEFVNSDKFI